MEEDTPIARLVLFIDDEQVHTHDLFAEDFGEFNPFEFGESVGYNVADVLTARGLI